MFIGNVDAQSDLVMYDGDGRKFVVLVGTIGRDSHILVIRRDDGLLMQIAPDVNGGARVIPCAQDQNAPITSIGDVENNCEGRAFFWRASYGYVPGQRGGFYFQYGDDFGSSGFAKIGWGAVGEAG